MKTFKTNRGIEFDVEFIKVFPGVFGDPNNEIIYSVTCSEGSKNFTYEYKHHGNLDVTPEEAESILFDGEFNFQEAHDWVEAIEIESIFEELRAFVMSGQILSFTAFFDGKIEIVVKPKNGPVLAANNIDDIDGLIFKLKE